MTDTRVEQLRAQGLRTRARLLEKAEALLAADSSASLSAVAKAADVGIGTLYRHFPTREALVMELYRHEVHDLAAAADRLLETMSPIDALRRWLDHYAQFILHKAGLVDALRGSANHGRFSQVAYEPVTAAIERLLRAGTSAQQVRPEITAEDILLATDGLYLVSSEKDRSSDTARLFDIITTGVRSPH
jgi:AcrR family transcriptional regulator